MGVQHNIFAHSEMQQEVNLSCVGGGCISNRFFDSSQLLQQQSVGHPQEVSDSCFFYLFNI